MSVVAIDPCTRCGGVEGKLPHAALCDSCAAEWLAERQAGGRGEAPEADAAAIRFLSAAEIRASTPVEPAWILDGYLAPYCVTLEVGRPKVGKSRKAAGIARACSRGASSFAGRALRGGPVVWISEESAPTLAHKLPDTDRLRILTRENAWPRPEWPALVAAGTAECKRIGAELLIVDTVPYWAALPPEREKDSGAAILVMQALLAAASEGIAVYALAHTRKGGGEDGEAVRGSSAFAGAVDIIVELERVPDQPHQRALLALSRFPSTPGTLVIELDPETDEWRPVSEDADRASASTIAARNRADADRQAILDALASGEPLTRAELEDAVGAPSRQWHPILDALLKADAVTRSGAGRKGNPYRFQILRTDTAQDDAQNCAENRSGAVADSAHSYSPLKGGRNAETATTPAESAEAARCAETDADLQARAERLWARHHAVAA